ncbi:unnamed protein product [Dicrocoelium dendriticum]|nr:unnamed protein product [Dicrocoelium dendriticum]
MPELICHRPNPYFQHDALPHVNLLKSLKTSSAPLPPDYEGGCVGSSILCDDPVGIGRTALTVYESLELSDDAGQENNFSRLSDNVLDLLELQFTGLKLWHTMEPPPPPPSSQNTQSAEATFLQSTVASYEMLVRDMSRKFGFYVGHLRVTHLKYGPENMISTVERRSSSSALGTRQQPTLSSAQPPSTRVFQKVESLVPTDSGCASLRLDRSRSGARASLDHGSYYTSDGKSDL